MSFVIFDIWQSKITNCGLTQSGIRCFITVSIWQQGALKGLVSSFCYSKKVLQVVYYYRSCRTDKVEGEAFWFQTHSVLTCFICLLPLSILDYSLTYDSFYWFGVPWDWLCCFWTDSLYITVDTGQNELFLKSECFCVIYYTCVCSLWCVFWFLGDRLASCWPVQVILWSR